MPRVRPAAPRRGQWAPSRPSRSRARRAVAGSPGDARMRPRDRPCPARGGGIASTAAPGPDDASCRRRPRIERVRARPVSTSVVLNGPGFAPRFERRTAVGDRDGPRPSALRILMELRKPGPALGRGPAAHGAGPDRGGGGGRWPVALMATRLGPDGRVRGGARRRISPPRLQQAWQQRHGLLEAPCRDYPAAGGPHPLEGPSERPSGVLAGPAPGLRPPAARRALGRHQAPTRVVPAPARDRADLAPASAPRPSSTPSRTSPVHPPGDPRPWPAPGNPRPRARHGPRISRAVPREAPSPLRGHPR